MFTLSGHFQSTLIHVPSISESYSILFFTTLNFTFNTRHIHNWVLFFFDSISSFFLELFLYFSPVAYWAHTDLGSSSFSVMPFHIIHGVLKTRILKLFAFRFFSGLHFVITLCHDLSWVALHGIAHSFIELDTAVVHVISLVNFLWLWFSFCLPSDG